MGAIAKIKIGGRWSFGANRKEWGDQEYTISGITRANVVRMEGTLASKGSAYLFRSGYGMACAHTIYIQNVSATSSIGDLYVYYSGEMFMKVRRGEAAQFSPKCGVASMKIYNSGQCSAISFDYSIIGTTL